ncbi:hypothetical protein [Mycolicibacter algericus]|uniref:hypothetical protein n=1 Tax=Mycolicibacter algericus TaxID=1288388 RepID=UPI003C742C07
MTDGDQIERDLAAARKMIDTWLVARTAGHDAPVALLTDDARVGHRLMLNAALIKLTELTVPATATDDALTTGDYRRAAALACAVATNDTLGSDVVVCEAAEKGRLRHTLLAAAVSIAQGFRADTQQGLEALRHTVNELSKEEGN